MTRVFISYKREDEAFARSLRESIISWGFDTWLDVVDIDPGTGVNSKGWDDAIHAGMIASQVVVGVLAPESLRSANVLDEWGWALENNRRLFLLWLRDIPAEDIPPRYTRIQRIDCRANLDSALQAFRDALESPSKIVRNHNHQIGVLSAPTGHLSHSSKNRGRLISHVFSQTANSVNADSSRREMIEKVRAYWIEGVLKPTLHSGSMEIGLQIKPDAVLKHRDYGDYMLPEDADILRIFEDMQRELLILGAPGAGKTMLMLELAEKLLDRAEADDKAPLLVVFNLSSWAARREPLDKWLQERLRHDYQVPRKLARQWVENPALLLLLDGLDEVAEAHRDECVAAINTFRGGYTWVDVVVCSRIEEYEQLTRQLDLDGAVLLQPLTAAEIEAYLSKPELKGVRELVRADPIIREMAETPFLLNAMGIAYVNTPQTALMGYPRLEARRDHLLARYVAKRFRDDTGYTFKQVHHYLAWLSWSLKNNNLTTFQIEEIQRHWLGYDESYFKGLEMLLLMISFSLGLISLVPFLLEVPKLTILFGIMANISLMVMLLLPKKIVVVELVTWRWTTIPFLMLVFFLGSLPGVLAGTADGGLQVGMVSFIIFLGPFMFLFFYQMEKDYRSRKTALLIALAMSVGGIGAFGGTLGFISGQLTDFVTSIKGYITLVDTLALMVFISLGGLLLGSIAIDPVSNFKIRIKPNQGIWDSLENSLRVALVHGLLSGTCAGVAVTAFLVFLTNNFHDSIIIGVLIALIFCLIVGLVLGILVGGGKAVIYHFVLRIWLYRKDYIPWNYAKFLDYCAEIGLLRKVGGGYIFVHRYLLEYFAGLEETEVG